MSDNKINSERISEVLKAKKIDFYEKKMFGGMCFMVNEKMLMGTFRGGIMARVNPDEIPELLKKEGTELMTQKGRTLKGYVMLTDDAHDMESDLEFWVDKCMEWNPFAKSSKKKK